MRCSKCGTQSPDATRFCPVCGNKLQSDRSPGPGGDDGTAAGGQTEPPRRLLDFQGWVSPRRGLGPFIEASVYAAALLAAVVVCVVYGHFWPLYPVIAVLALVAWLRRL